MEAALKQIVRDHLPKPFVEKLTSLWKMREHFTKLYLAPPVAQMYVNDDLISSYIGINNFYSCLVPELETNALMEICLYDSNGTKLFSENMRLNHFGATSISIRKLLDKRNIKSPCGMVTAQLVPQKSRRKPYKRIGLSTAHFFMYYHGSNGSMSHVHPSSILDENNKASGDFTSNQLIHSKNLKKIILYQLNPSFHPCEISHFILPNAGTTDQAIASTTNMFAPLSMKKIEFDLTKISNLPEILNLYISKLPSSNSKPMLLRCYEGDLFSMSHS